MMGFMKMDKKMLSLVYLHANNVHNKILVVLVLIPIISMENNVYNVILLAVHVLALDQTAVSSVLMNQEIPKKTVYVKMNILTLDNLSASNVSTLVNYVPP